MAKTRVTITTKKGKAGAKGKKSKAAPQKKKFDLGDLPEEVAEQAREIWLAGLGALSAVEEEGSKVFKKLVARGEAWEREGRKQLSGATNKAKARVADAADDLDDLRASAQTEIGETITSVQKSVERVLGRFSSSMSEEVSELRGRIESLAGQVSALAQEAVGEATGTAKKGAKKAAKKTGATTSTIYELVPRKDGWALRAVGAQQATRTFKTKKEGLSYARDFVAKQAPSELVVHRQDGSVQDRVTYDAA